MTRLNHAQLAVLRSALEQELRQREARLAQHHDGLSRAAHAREVLQQDGDDAPQREGEREIDMALSDRETLLMGAAAEALRRMEGDRYGVCTDCDAPIPFARLLAEPSAVRCIRCEAVHEQQQPQRL